MTFDNAITVGPEFFAKAKNDYSDWYWAIAREFMQNSIDCGSSRIEIELRQEGLNTRLVITNNGDPMSEHILRNKLLALGASGKDFASTVGGFGKAKEILYFCHLLYEIHSGSLLVEGQGAGYNLSDASFRHGTRSSILIEGGHVSDLERRFRTFALECQWSGELFLNEERLVTNLKKGSRRRDLGWAVIYTNKTFRHRLIVRIDGMPMFSRYVNLDRCVIVEVKRSSGEALTSNRDGLVLEYRHKLEAWVDQLTVDKSRALRDVPITTYHHFDGDRQRCGGTNSEPVRDLVTAAYATLPQPAPINQAENTPTLAVDREANYDDGPSFVDAATHLERPDFVQRAHCSFEFIVKNNTGLQIPDHFLPYGFSAYSKKLVNVWVKCLLELHRMFDHEDTFAVGFILDDEREAEHEKTDEYGRVYYINPAVIVTQSSSNSRSLKKRWKFNNAGNYMVMAAAVHEFVHGQGHSPHDEGYASKLTSKLAVVMANKKLFHPCFR